LTVIENHLIRMLPARERQRILAICEPVPLILADVLCTPAKRTRYAYFPTEGFISLLTSTSGSPELEVGMVGREGMLGVQMVLGVSATPLRAIVQGSGTAWRVDAGAFRKELERSPMLRRVLNRYLYVLMIQLTTSAGCLRFHQIGPRLARWLLMSQDRAHADSFRMTHEFLAYLLGVRRVGITVAANALQHSGLIAYHRGDLTVLDRNGLEMAACGCYEADRKAYADTLDSR
jgi:CRP-like cAMP-binding protein